jgi:plastocyanin
MSKWIAVLAIVTLTTSLTAGDAWGKDYEVEIANLKYKPAKLKIKKGDKVIWINSDDRDHTVASKDKGKSFDSGKIAAGEKFEHTFEKAGKYEYGCEYHPRMKGEIEVTE